MVQPYNYMLNLPDPTQSVLSGVQQGLQIATLMDERKAMQQQAAEQQRLQTALAGLGENPTTDSIAKIMLDFPALGDKFKGVYDVLDANEKEARVGQAQRVYSAITAGQPEVAMQILDESATAYENSNRPQDAKTMRDLAEVIKLNPETAAVSTGMFLANAMGPDKFAATFKALEEQRRGPEQFEILTAEQAANMGLEPGVTYQRNLKTNQIKPVGTGAGVTVDIAAPPPGETKYEEETGRIQAQTFAELSKMGSNAARALLDINSLESAFKSAAVRTGPQGFVASALANMGIEVEGGKEYEQIKALVSRLIPAQRPPGGGPMSDADAILYANALPKLLGTKEGQLQIIADIKAVNEYDRKLGEIANLAISNQISRGEAQRRIAQLSNPLERYRNQGGAGEAGAPAAPAAGGFSVQTKGGTFNFESQEQADQFRRQAQAMGQI